MLTTPPQPRLTGGSERPETPCTRDVDTRLAALRLTGTYPPSPFDLAIEYQNARGWRYRQAVSEARAICAGCPAWEMCLRENRDADGVIAGLTLAERIGRKPPTRRKGCGKPHGASNHSRAGERACEECKAAQAKAQRNRKRSPSREIRHGTDTGYSRHRKAGEEACEPCKEAHRLSERLRAKRKRQEEAA